MAYRLIPELFLAKSANEELTVAALDRYACGDDAGQNAHDSVSGDREVDGYAGVGFDPLPSL